MTVKRLKHLLSAFDDDATVVIPVVMDDDRYFLSPVESVDNPPAENESVLMSVGNQFGIPVFKQVPKEKLVTLS